MASAEAAEGRLQTEARNVPKLESFSLTGIWSQLKRPLEDDMARESAERRAAEYEDRTQRARADADQHHVEDLTGRLAAFGDVECGNVAAFR
ncbi:hypothetical protein [Mycolicibacterium fortuitum]|uniref:hypothetical protein n=1 Tax=Mycolicibacterium fortuitum TaxID=1766 RepID=UPI003AAADA23